MENILSEFLCAHKIKSDLRLKKSGFNSLLNGVLAQLFNLRERLEFSTILINEVKQNLIGYFSNSEIEILKKLISTKESTTSGFFENIIQNNVITYKDSPRKNINSFINSCDLEILDVKNENQLLTQWVSLGNSQKDSEKINKIVSNKLYLASTMDFNDRFDSQIHINNELENMYRSEYMYKLINNVKNYIPVEESSRTLCYIKDLCNLNFMSCYSKLNPLSFDSSIMWGHYGARGVGFALEYSLINIYKFFFEWVASSEKSKLIIFEPVFYNKEHSPHIFISQLLKECFKKGNHDDTYKLSNAKEASIKFILNKNDYWKYEEEVRIILRPNLNIHNNSIEKFRNFADYMTMANYREFFDNIRQAMMSKEDNVIPFCKPEKIILGWNYSQYECPELYEKLVRYAHTNRIEIGYIDKYPNYIDSSFFYTRL